MICHLLAILYMTFGFSYAVFCWADRYPSDRYTRAPPELQALWILFWTIPSVILIGPLFGVPWALYDYVRWNRKGQP